MAYHYPTETKSDRQKHLQWCKDRALEHVDAGDLTNAISSMLSDMSKRDDTAVDPMLGMLGMMELQNGSAAVRRWVEGFN